MKSMFLVPFLLFFISCGGSPTKTDAYIYNANEPTNTNDENKIIKIDRQKQIESIKKELGARFRDDIVTSKDKKDLFVRANARYGYNEEILNYDITQQDPVYKGVVAKNSDGSFFGMFSLSTGKFIYVYENYYIIVGKYDVKKQEKVWTKNVIIAPPDYTDSTAKSLHIDPNEKYIIIGKYYKIDISSNWDYSGGVECIGGSRRTDNEYATECK